jgi:CubicO group peptidase (beta-lactamase class C family)
MSDLRFERVRETVEQELARLPIPGAAVGVLYEDEEHLAGFGSTNIEHPQPVTPETLFQIGSITKTFVGTLVMRLVEHGKLALDAPLRTYLPELQLRDETASQHATLRHCLTHTGGWEGDYFDDFGRGENALAKMVAAMAALPQLTPLGAMWSYNNAGFYLAGRAIEKVMGQPFETVMREWLLEPLGLAHAYFFAEELITYSFAVGHQVQGEKTVVARPWALARTANPAGGIVTNLPTLLRYARFQMGNGLTTEGKRLLVPGSLAQMQSPLAPAQHPLQVGLTWYLQTVNGVKLIEHGGGTHGQVTRLVIAPELGFAAAILTNSERGGTLVTNVLDAILDAFLGFTLPVPPALALPASDLAAYVGRYAAAADSVEVSISGDQLALTITDRGGFPTPQTPPTTEAPMTVEAVLYAPDRLYISTDLYKHARGAFLRDQNGDIAWLRLFWRIHKRLP